MSNTANEQDSIWAGDRLERKRDADYLSNFLLNRYTARPDEKGFVLALNGDWGTGKSFLLRRWCDDLRRQGNPAIYFDAWENDYTPQPLVAFIASLNEGLIEYSKLIPRGPALRSALIKKVAPAIAPAIKALGYTALKTFAGISADKFDELIEGKEISLGSDDLKPSEIAKEATKQLQRVVNDALKEHTSTKKAIAAFRSALSAIIDGIGRSNNIQLPFYIFIDELDRCRPNYAIELLEGIKHLFGVPGIYFVIATNMAQLGESTRAIYGPSFDGQQYLKRFFDMEYVLPEPEKLAYAKELFANAAMPNNALFVVGTLAHASDFPYAESQDLKALIFARYADAFRLTLRDQEQVMRIVEASALTLHPRPIHVYLLFFLAMTFHKSPLIYRKLAESRSTGDASGVRKIYTNENNVGSFTVKVHNGTYIQNGGDKKITPLEIFEIYLSVIRTYNYQNIRVNAFDFPANIVNEIFDQQGRREQLEDYFEVVHRAGAFSSRD